LGDAREPTTGDNPWTRAVLRPSNLQGSAAVVLCDSQHQYHGTEVANLVRDDVAVSLIPCCGRESHDACHTASREWACSV